MNRAAEILWRQRLEAWSGWWSESCWRACWQGGVFILLAWGLCRLLPALSPRVRHWLWLLACLKLALGLFWAAPLVVPVRTGSLPSALIAPAPSRTASTPSLAGTGREYGSVPAVLSSPVTVNPLLSWRVFLFVSWLCGVLAGIALAGRETWALRRLCRNARSLDSMPLAAQAREMGVLMGLTRVPRLAEADAISAPLVIGPLRPLILLPPDFATHFPGDEARLALAHELAHIRRGDLWLSLLPVLAQTLFFFFPPVWLACREWLTAREAACDYEALAITDAPPVLYGNLLLKLVSQEKAPQMGMLRGALGATANYHTLKRRLAWLQRRTRSAQPMPPRMRLAAALTCMPCLLLLCPWHIQAARLPVAPPATPSADSATTPMDPANTPALDLRVSGDLHKRYLLIGTQSPMPAGGYHLLVVLPGGDGSANFQYFVKRIQAFGLPPGYLVAELIAPQWTPTQAHALVWPTRTNSLSGVRFSTEDFVEDVIRDVKTRASINGHYVFTLGWASGGPACYAVALQPDTQTQGAFIAMSVFTPAALPSLSGARKQRFFLHQPLDTNMAPLDMATQARSQLRAQGAAVELVTYEGGYGWHGHVYPQIRRGIDWLEQSRGE